MKKMYLVLFTLFFCFKLTCMDLPRSGLRSRKNKTEKTVTLSLLNAEGAYNLLEPNAENQDEGQIATYSKDQLTSIRNSIKEGWNSADLRELENQKEQKANETLRYCCLFTAGVCCCGFFSGLLTYWCASSSGNTE